MAGEVLIICLPIILIGTAGAGDYEYRRFGRRLTKPERRAYIQTGMYAPRFRDIQSSEAVDEEVDRLPAYGDNDNGQPLDWEL
ncbi:hypothetical protein TWF481_005259 [Arthrobotrys musiformis]|uniref:Uncharacterized protein n=1 Tax=Arthrobotrys musiformis TaxID=47236 RepID=A0AAV9WF73_9PEZI